MTYEELIEKTVNEGVASCRDAHGPLWKEVPPRDVYDFMRQLYIGIEDGKAIEFSDYPDMDKLPEIMPAEWEAAYQRKAGK